MRYRERAAEVEAMQWTGDNLPAIESWHHHSFFYTLPRPDGQKDLQVATVQGIRTVRPGDWVVRDKRGDLTPCQPDRFAATYEPVEGAHG